MSAVKEIFSVIGVAAGLLREALGVAGEHVRGAAGIAEDHIRRYFATLRKWFVWYSAGAILGAVLLGIALACGLRVNWLLTTYIIVLGFGACFLYVAFLPIVLSWEAVTRAFPGMKRVLQVHTERVCDILFSAIIVAIYFWVAPISRNPSVVPLVLLIAAAIATGAVARRIYFDSNHRIIKGLRVAQLVFLLAFASMSLAFPRTVQAIANAKGLVDDNLADSLRPQLIEVTEPNGIRFVSEIDGKPRIWFYASPDGSYELFDRPGFHRTGASLVPADSAQDRQRIVSFFLARDQARREQARITEERSRQEAQERQSEVERQRQAEEAERERERKARGEAEQRERADALQRERHAFLDRYIGDQLFTNQPHRIEIAVVAANPDGTADRTLATAVASTMKGDGVLATADLFTPAFCTDGRFERLCAGAATEVDELGLQSRADWLVLCKVVDRKPGDAPVAGLVSTRLSASIWLLDTSSQQSINLSLQQAGAGFSETEAWTAACERLAAALARTQEARVVLERTTP